jgi:membrane dipeptidase
VIGVENGYPIGTDIQRVKEFYDRGGRYMSLAHNGNSQLSDSNTGEKDGYLYNNGLSLLGRQVIAAMNRLGMMIDVSHPSKGSMMEAVRLSKAPIIASHSAIRALANVSRNMDDEQLLALKKNGGVIQIVALSGFLKPGPAGGNSGAGGAANPPAAASAPATPRCPIEGSVPAAPPSTPGRANVKDFVNHIDYAVKLIGIDHVGISSDFDGGGGIDGWNSAAEAFNVTLELVRRGYTEQQIAKLWGGNLLHVWSEVEKVAKELQKK